MSDGTLRAVIVFTLLIFAVLALVSEAWVIAIFLAGLAMIMILVPHH